jgi:putative ABC transport system permease protein
MIRLAFRDISRRRLRTALTGLAVVLGVAMIAAGYMVGDTLLGAQHQLSDAAYSKTDAVVGSKTLFNSDDNNSTKPQVSAAMLARVRAVPGVATASGSITDTAQIIDRHGKAVSGSGPTFGLGVDTSSAASEQLTGLQIRTGRFPAGPGEVALDPGTVSKQHWKLGDEVRIAASGTARTYRLVGTASFGSLHNIGAATAAVFDLRTAQAILHHPGAYDGILVGAAHGTSPAAVRQALARSLPHTVGVKSAKADDRYTLDGLKSFVTFIRTVLVGFGMVTILVAAFLIFNTLSITVAQRSRELAMLRAVGASRRQVLGSVVAEALAIGTAGAALGLAAGYGLAKGLMAMLRSFGIDLPTVTQVFETRTLVVSLLVGVVVTVLAGLAPALRATRVSPTVALRDGVEIPPGRIGRYAPWIAAVMCALGVLLVVVGMNGGAGKQVTDRLLGLGVGCLAIFVGVALISPRLARPLASALGWPSQRFGGAAGRLARRNAMRNPGRTASTAAALMIGIALVSFVATLANGLRSSSNGTLAHQIRADYAVSSTDGSSPVDGSIASRLKGAPGVRSVSTIREDQVLAYGHKAHVNGVDPATIADVYGFRWKHGSDAALAGLKGDRAVVRDDFAAKHHLTVGDRFAIATRGAQRLTLSVAAIERPPALNPLGLGEVTVARSLFDRTFPVHRDAVVFVRTAPGASAAVLDARLAGFPTVQVQTKAKFIDGRTSFLSQIEGILYVLLALAVLISLLGIANTQALSVLERTRELGVLRAVGSSRRQLRRLVRHESVITTLLGAALGMALGVALAALVTGVLSTYGLGFSLPVGALVVFGVLAALAGVLAGALPARRAGRLDVIAALAHE